MKEYGVERWDERSSVEDCRCGARYLVTECDKCAERAECALCGAPLAGGRTGARRRLVDDSAVLPLVRAVALAEAGF